MIWRWIKYGGRLQRPLDYPKVTLRKASFKGERPLRVPRINQHFRKGWSSDQWLSWLRPDSDLSSRALSPPVAKRCRKVAEKKGRIQPVVAFTLSVVTLTAAMGQRFYRQPELQVGTIAPKTVWAPEMASVYDAETTESQRAAARNGAIPILVPDMDKNEQILNALERLLREAEEIRQTAGAFPLVAVNRLPTSTQRYLREASLIEWQGLWAVVQDAVTSIDPDAAQSPDIQGQLERRADFRALTEQQQQVVLSLIRYRQQQSSAAFRSLQRQLEIAQTSYQQALVDWTRLATTERNIPSSADLLWLSETEWQETQKGIERVLEHMLLQGIAAGVPPEVLATAAAAHLQEQVPAKADDLANALLTAVLEPNLIEDPEKTREKAEAAAEQVPAVTVTIQPGEVIVREGETIDQSAFVLLDYFQLSQRRLNTSGLIGFGVLVTVASGIFLYAERTVLRPVLKHPDYVLIICVLLGVSSLSVVGLSVYSLPAVSLLISSFYGSTLGFSLIVLLSALLPIGARVSAVPLIASAAGALVCSVIAPRLRSREEIALLGGIVGLIQGAVYLAVTWMISPISAATWYLPLTGAVLQGIYGVVSSVVALGLSPYLEHLFDLVTPIRLAELSSPNRPMLKRLASEAPGTFQHTLFVASLAEAAARALGCNVELVRAGTLYHDIGKMHDPLGFIENQMGGPNKHDEINDPWVSADIIKKHVSEGIIMARRCRLPKAVRAFIPEHQGTMLISYFYYQAQERAQSDETLVVDECDFRYDGPIPQSPETGIVMLADSCEAALRSLEEASTEEALAMVNRILKARWQDQQLIDSGLSREHVGIVAQVFVQVWQQYNHKRIAYPKASLSPVANRP